MSKYIDINYEPLNEKHVAKEVFNLYGSLQELYMELMLKYKDLEIALFEADMSKETDLDIYVHACNKISYLSIEISNLLDKELKLFNSNMDLLPFLEINIKRRFNIKKSMNFDDFSIFDTYINSHYKKIKNNYVIIRMIRAINYYKEYNKIYITEYLPFDPTYEDTDIVKLMMTYDYADLEAFNTLAFISDSAIDSFGKALYNKYRCLFAFTNPLVENFYIQSSFETKHPCLVPKIDDKILKIVKTNIVKTLVAIQNSKVVNLNCDGKENDKIFNRKLTIKQAADILLHYNKATGKYDSKFEALTHDYNDNMEEIILLFSYLKQSYMLLDEENLNDIDNLLKLMCDTDNISYGKTKLSKKVVNYFFDKKQILDNPVRKRKKEDELN